MLQYIPEKPLGLALSVLTKPKHDTVICSRVYLWTQSEWLPNILISNTVSSLCCWNQNRNRPESVHTNPKTRHCTDNTFGRNTKIKMVVKLYVQNHEVKGCKRVLLYHIVIFNQTFGGELKVSGQNMVDVKLWLVTNECSGLYGMRSVGWNAECCMELRWSHTYLLRVCWRGL